MDGLNLIAALGGALLLASAVVVVLRHRSWLRRRHVIGLRWCGLLLELVLRMQQHRGMASAMRRAMAPWCMSATPRVRSAVKLP